MLKSLLAPLKKSDAPVARAASGFVPPEAPPPVPDAGAGARVTLWVEAWCSDSRKAKRLCVERGWPTHIEDLGTRHAEKLALFRTHGRRQLPLVFVDGAFLGGWKELAALEALPPRG